nr:oligosaccharide flippase family protein [uncultured Blautia sp.]
MDTNIKALKSGVWYTAANFIIKGIGFLSTPIFTRLFTQEQYGLFNNYISWESTFNVFVSLQLVSTFVSARFDFKDKFDEYVSSLLVFNSIISFGWLIIINVFSNVFTGFTGIELRCLNIMIVYLLFASIIEMFQARERFLYKYKITVITSLFIALSTAVISVILVILMEDKLWGRIIGNSLPTIFIGILLSIVLLYNGKKNKAKYWRYALPVCLPYIPHILSMTVLNSMDRIMITKICGARENALYSVAYSCGAVITILMTSINSAFVPWLGSKLYEHNYEEIRKISEKYIGVFVYISCGLMLITPELLYVMGGNKYQAALYVMPPISFGCICQFIYTMYVNVEQFNKKTIGMAIASTIAALSNYILNMILLPIFGFLAAAYTTLVSYMILLFIHMVLVYRLKLGNIYPIKLIKGVLIFMIIYTTGINLLYSLNIIRHLIIICYIIGFLTLIYKYRNLILMLLNKPGQEKNNCE